MNREIKFRAWDYQNNKWATNRGVSDSVGLVFDIKDYFINIAGERALRFVFQQYTGLKDKNGKEIYEGDIVAREYYHNNPPSKRPKVKFILARLPVKFDGGSFGLDDSAIRSTDYGTTYNNWWGDECEIIGNIYENHELLTPNQ